MKIKEKLQQLLELTPFITEEILIEEMLNIVYSYHKKNTLKLFLQIQELEKKRIQEENNLLYRGLQDAMHLGAHGARELLENKTSKQAKDYFKCVFKSKNIAYVINICKAYFPNGTSEGASNNGKWFFEQFVTILKENKDRYLEGGKSYEWAKIFDHLNYINLVLENNKDDSK